MDDASFPSLVNQISCLLLHYLHISAIALLLFLLLLTWFCSMMCMGNGQLGDSKDREKWEILVSLINMQFSFAVTHSKGHQSELILNA